MKFAGIEVLERNFVPNSELWIVADDKPLGAIINLGVNIMAETALKTFVVERDANRTIEIKAERAEQDAASSRVTFFIGDNAVGSFINIQGYYIKS